jgi:hypothetical protein
MVQAADPLEILLPGSDERALSRARGVVQFLRLLSDDACSTRASAVGVGLEQARSELDRQDRCRVESALCDLLRHHLSALSTPDTFLWWGEPALDHHAAWRTLGEFSDDLPWLARVPEPGEPAHEVAARLLDSLERSGSGAAEACLWRARIARFAEGPRPAEKLLRAEIARLSGPDPASGPDRRARRALAACLTECLLDRGAVREARAWLAEHGVLVQGDARLRQLLSWSLVCLGDYAGAKTALVGLPPWSGVIPAGLVDLRAHRPEWLPCMSGKAPPERPRQAACFRAPSPIRERIEVGAAALGVFAFRPGGEVHPLVLDAAPALRQGIDTWLRERDGACAVAGERENELVVGARTVVVHRDGDRAIDGALGRDGTMALALAPVLDDEGEVAGWLHVECEHHLLPGSARLAWMAQDWRREVLARRSGGGDARTEMPADSAFRAASIGAVRARGSVCAEVFDGLVTDLGIKTAQRRWCAFGIEAGEPRLIATGGEAAGLSEVPSGRGRALTRALATCGRVSFDEPDARLSLDERAGSGVVLALSAGGTLCGLLAIESSRRHDFREPDLVRYAEVVERTGLALRLSQFSVWHRERFGFEVWFDALRADFRAFALHLLAAARSRSPVVLFGPAGSGKMVLARWMHFESRSRDGSIRVVGCGSQAVRGGIAEWLASARGGSLVLEEVERLAPDRQEELLRLLEDENSGADREDPPARILATTRLGLRQAVEEGRLRNDLAHRLDRLQFCVPALRERREDILPLVACISRRFAEEEGLRAPVFNDEALALLWRQRWDGNVRELESFLYKLVLLARGERGRAVEIVEPAQVRDIAGRFSLQLVRRLPSRHPLRSDLLAALRVTRKPGGRLNKTRAALYLGWDPDTLVARMQDAGIGEEVRDEDVWTIAPAEPADEE